jgi:hypothetical protein
MRTSSFAALALVALVVAFLVLVLTPRERSTASLDTPSWSTQR